MKIEFTVEQAGFETFILRGNIRISGWALCGGDFDYNKHNFPERLYKKLNW